MFYVDDMLTVGKDKTTIEELKKKLHKTCSMKELGKACHILQMRIERERLKKILRCLTIQL